MNLLANCSGVNGWALRWASLPAFLILWTVTDWPVNSFFMVISADMGRWSDIAQFQYFSAYCSALESSRSLLEMKKSISLKALVPECLKVTLFFEKIAWGAFFSMNFLYELKSPHHSQSSAFSICTLYLMSSKCCRIVVLTGVLTFSADTGFIYEFATKMMEFPKATLIIKRSSCLITT